MMKNKPAGAVPLADLLGSAIPERREPEEQWRNQNSDWLTDEINGVKQSFDCIIRLGNKPDQPNEWGSFPPICPHWKWEWEYREQYNAILDWIIGRPSKCNGNEVLPSRGLWLMGNLGTGKTTLMRGIKNFCAIYDDTRSPNMPRSMYWRHAKDLVSSFEQEGAKVLDILCDEVETLIIDDVGTEEREAMSYGSIRNVVEDILSRRYDRGKMTMVTTNLGFNQVKEYYRQRVFDRIRENFNVIEFYGESHRKKYNPLI